MSQPHAGFRVYEDFERPAPAVLDAYRELSGCVVSDASHGIYTMTSSIRHVAGRLQAVGPAATAVVTPGDGLMVRMTIDTLRPGDILVVNAFGDVERAILGGTVMSMARDQGAAAVVIDGAVRDLAELEAIDVPTFARAVTTRSGSTSAGWGEVNVPVACGGVVVHPGDIVVADEDGVVVVPLDVADSVLTAGLQVQSTKGEPGQVQRDPALRRQRYVHQRERSRRALTDRGGTLESGVYRRTTAPSA